MKNKLTKGVTYINTTGTSFPITTTNDPIEDLNKQLEELKKKLDEQGFKPADNFLEQQKSAFEMMKSPFKSCQRCPNNPANNPFASGVCCCSIPDQEMIKF